MSTEGWNVKWDFKAAEDLNTTGHEGIAIALADNKVANDGKEACGVLSQQSKPESGEHGAIVVMGIAKFRAGVAASAGDQLTVTTSGYFIAVNSGLHHCGRALEAVTSGSVGAGLFNFGFSAYQVNCFGSQ